MKLLPFILAHAAALTAFAQQSDITNQMQNAGFTVTARAEHQRVWSKLSSVTNSGTVSTVTNSITELTTGLHRWVSNHWVVATPEIVLTGTGIVARGASHSALFATNANTYAAVQTRLPDGQILKSHVLGLAYQDQSTGSNLMFAVLKDCTAQIVGSRRLAYLSCFDGAEASLVYSYSRAGLSQDVIFYGKPAPPSAFGLNDETTHLLVLTEFITPPTPQIQEQTWPAGLETLADQSIDFSSMRMFPGHAYLRSGVNRGEGLAVAKTWATIQGRTALIERLQFHLVRETVADLPDEGTVTNSPDSTLTNASINKVSGWYAQGSSLPRPSGAEVAGSSLPLPEVRGEGERRAETVSRVQSKPRLKTATMKASVAGDSLVLSLPPPPNSTAPSGPVNYLADLPDQKGFVVDWNLITVTYGSDFTFHCGSGSHYLVADTTYLIGAHFDTGSLVKFGMGCSLTLNGPLTFVQNGSCPQMAKLTSVNDNSDGFGFPGSSGTPAAGDYGPALTLNCSDVALAESNLQILYANPGIVPSVPCQSTVTIKATDPGAIKGASPHDGIFTITRVSGDWTKPLYVAFSLTGSTAVSGVDYQSISTGVYIPTSAGSVTVPVHPINPYPAGTAQFQIKVVLTLQTSAGYTRGSAYVTNVFIDDPAVPITTAPIVAPSGLLAWWRAESDCKDSKGTADGILHNSATFGSGIIGQPGQAFSLNGTGAHVHVTDQTPLHVTTAATIEGWVNYASIGAYHEVVSKWDAVGGFNQRSYSIGTYPDGRIYFAGSHNGTDTGSASVPTFSHVVPGQWTHFAGTYDGTNLRIYLNGLLENTVSWPGAFYAGVGDLGIGGAVGGSGTVVVSPFGGRIDDLALYNAVLSDSQLLAIYNAGRAGKCVPPFNITAPSSQTINYGVNPTFTVSAKGGPLTYQWRKNGAPISGATLTSCTLIRPGVGDLIDVIVSSTGCSGATTLSAPLTVNPISLTISADNKSKATGSANPAFTYTPSGLISGDSITVGYITTATAYSPAGTYDIIPTVSSANYLLRNYTLTVNKGTLTIGDVPVILTQPQGLSRNQGNSAIFSVQAAGSPTLAYQWKKNGASISGATMSQYSITPVALADVGTYSVFINNDFGSATSAGAYLSVGNVLITQQPRSQTVVPNSTANFDVITLPSTGLTFQWSKGQLSLIDNAPKISGAQSKPLTITDVTTTDRGNYWVTVQGSVPSAGATLDVCQIYPLAVHKTVISDHKIGEEGLTATFHDNSFSSGDFGWLSWDGSSDTPNLQQAWITPLGTGAVRYNNPANPLNDHIITRAKTVSKVTGARESVIHTIYDLKSSPLVGDDAIPITVVVYDTQANGTYRVYSFAKIRLRSISTAGHDASMTFDYLGVAECNELNTVNLAPELSISATPLTYTENDPPKIIDSTGTIVDYDSPTFAGGSLTLDFTVNGQIEDSLSIQAVPGAQPLPNQIDVTNATDGTVSVTYGGTNFGSVVGYLGHNTLTISFNSNANRDAIQALLQKITYYNLSDNPSEATRTLRFIMNDGTTTPIPVTKTIMVTAVNDPPTLADIPDITVTTDGQQRRVQLTGITAGGGENQTLVPSAVTGNTALIPSATLTFDSYTSPATTGTLKFTPTANNSGVVILSVTITDTDAHGNHNTVTKSFKVTLVPPPPASDIPPTVTMPGPAVSYIAGSTATVLDNAATVTDPDSPNFSNGSLTVQFASGGSTDDRLSILTDSTISIASGAVSSGGTAIGTVTGLDTTQLSVAFNTSSTLSRVQPLLQHLTYRNVNAAPSLLQRIIQVVVTDGAGGTSQPVWKTINLLPAVNTPPTVTLGNPVTYLVGSAPLSISSSPTITDTETSQTDPGFSATITVKITGNADADDHLSIRNDGNVSGQFGVSSPGLISFGGVAIGQITSQGAGAVPLIFTVQTSLQTVQLLVQNLTFYNASANPSRLDRTIQLTVRETTGAQDSAPATKLVHISAPNQLPVVDAGPDQTAILSSGNAVAQLDGFVADDGLPNGTLSISWYVLEAPDGVDISVLNDPSHHTFIPPDSPTARANLPAIGRYVLLLTADDGAGAVSDAVTVFVCDAERKPKDVILIAEHSRYQIGTPPENFALRRASQFVDFLPLNQDQVGLVGYGDDFFVFLQHTLTHDGTFIKNAAPWAYERDQTLGLGDGIRLAALELKGPRHNPQAESLIVIFANLYYLLGTDQDFLGIAADAISAASEAKAAGIRIISIGLFDATQQPYAFAEATLMTVCSDVSLREKSPTNLRVRITHPLR